MRDLSIELKVGAVVIMALIILIYGIIWVKEYRINVETYEYTCLFPEVGTLDVGDPVSVLGVDKGEVKEIKLHGNFVRVRMTLTKDVELKEDISLVVMNVGLMGERFIAIKPGASETPLDLSTMAIGKYDTGIPEVMGMMGDAIVELRELVDQLEGTIGESGKAEQIRQIIETLFAITQETKSFISENSEAMAGAVGDLSNVAGRMSDFMDSNSTRMDTAMTNFAEASVKLNDISDNLQVLAEKVNKGEGTVGKVVNDDSLYFELRSTVGKLDSLVTDIQENPKKYLHISVF